MIAFSFLENDWECKNCHTINPGSRFTCAQCHEYRVLPQNNEFVAQFTKLIQERSSSSSKHIKIHKPPEYKIHYVILLNIIYPGSSFFYTKNYALGILVYILFSLPLFFYFHNEVFLYPFGALLLSTLSPLLLGIYGTAILLVSILNASLFIQ